MFPDRLVAGRKILALLTVVRIHLREILLKKPGKTRFFNAHFEVMIRTAPTGRSVCGSSELRAEAERARQGS